MSLSAATILPARVLSRAADLRQRSSAAALDAARCARFLKGALAHRARPDDVYISSYPRSGTTWLQLLVHLVHGGDMTFEHISQVVPWYERSLSLGRCTAQDFERMTSPRAFKSHLPYAWLPRGARYIYVHRDGRDVLVSYYHLYRSHLDYEGSFDHFFERFLAGELQYRSWFRHVQDWQVQAQSQGVLILAYEDMRSDPLRAVHQIAALCGVSLRAERARAIVELSSFEAMKCAENKFDHATGEELVQSTPHGSFVRQGRVGGHREVLSAEQQRRFEHALAVRRSSPFPEARLAAFLH